MGPRLEVGFRVAAGWRLFTEPRRWPLGRAKPLLKSSLSPAAAGAAMGVDFPLGTRGSRLMLSSTASRPDFPWGPTPRRYRRVPQRSSVPPSVPPVGL